MDVDVVRGLFLRARRVGDEGGRFFFLGMSSCSGL